MSWISSKLKVAETFLQQIDQQAAESLGKNENPRSEDDDLNNKNPKTTQIEPSSPSVVPLKDQFKKRSSNAQTDNSILLRNESSGTPTRQQVGKSTKPPPSSSSSSSLSAVASKPSNSSLTDTDWTQLLSTPPNKHPSPVPTVQSNGVSAIRSQLKKNVKKPVELKKNQKKKTIRNDGDFKSSPTLGTTLSNEVNGEGTRSKPSDGEESGSASSGDSPQTGDGPVEKVENLGNGVSQSGITMVATPELAKVADEVNGAAEIKKQVDENSDGVGVDESVASSRSSIARDLRGGSPSISEGTSASETDSSSLTSDSDKENERKAERARRRERVMAEKAAAKAVEAIKERENMVARLEGEKQSLVKILEERAKQQAQEASELQTSMMETMDAVDLEKQKHNTTRMEALARLTKLETANADLARSLATTQWNLEIEVNRVTELRQQVDLKEAVQEELRKKISDIYQKGSSPNHLEASKGVEFEQEILEAEYSFTCDKIRQLQEKTKNLEADIEIARKEMEEPTEVEVELKRRLAQLTDHLIQKQTQVEALSSEKAMMLFRIETVSRLLEEEKSMVQMSDSAGPSSREDLEVGRWGVYDSKLNPSFADRVRSGGQHLGPIIQQLDAIFCAGAAFLRRNSPAKFCSLVYLVCLHFWVVYIFMSNSQVSDTRSGAIVSLESINKTIGTP